MPTSTLTRPIEISPRHGTGNQKGVLLYNLKQVRTRIEQAINSFPKERPRVLITVKPAVIKDPPPHDNRSVEITISMKQGKGGPDDLPPHPPRKIQWPTS